MAVVNGNAVNLSTTQTGNGQTTNVGDRGGPDNAIASTYALVRIVTTVGSTPTCTYLIEGSADGSTWFPVAYADPATPTTVAVATFAITTATTILKILQPSPWRFLRVTMSANTNVTNTIDAFFFRG